MIAIPSRLFSLAGLFILLAGNAQASTLQESLERAVDGRAVTIEDCVRIALATNPALLASSHSTRSSEKAVLEAYSAYLPSLNGSFNATKASGTQTTAIGSFDGESRFKTTSLRLNQNILSWSSWRGIGQAKENREASRAGHRATRQDVVFRVREGFHNILRMKDLLEVSNDNLRVGEEQLKLAEKRKEVGAGVIADVLKAKAQVESNKLSVITAEKNLATSEATLLSSLGLDLMIPILPAEPDPIDPLLPSYEESLELAKKIHPELKRQEHLLASARDGIGAARGEWFPSLSGQLSYQWQDARLENERSDGSIFLSESFDRNWSANLSLSVPLFNAGTLSRIQQRKAEARSALWTLESTRQSVALEVREAILSIEENMKKMDVAERNVAAAEEDLRVSKGKYKHGLVPILDLIEAQVDLATARSEKVDAFYNYLTSQAALEKAIGLPEYNGQSTSD